MRNLKTKTADPEKNCALCPRLVEFRNSHRQTHPDWFNSPVPTFKSQGRIQLLIVGLAPGLRGANRTGRPFTGDFAGDLLYKTLLQFEFAKGHYKSDPNDGLQLVDCAITNAVRCVPPENKPTGKEIRSCRPFLLATIEKFSGLRAFLALGRIAHDTLVSSLDLKKKNFPFSHGAKHDLGKSVAIFDSYHCSRYNTNTGRLTSKMFESVVGALRDHVDS